GVAPGSYRIAARRDGYAAAFQEVEVPEAGLSGVDLRLEISAGLELTVLGSTGVPPPPGDVAPLGGAGPTVAAGASLVGDAGPCLVGEGGRVRLSQAPTGTFLLLVNSAAAATVALPVGVPGPAVRIALPDRTSLTVTAPGLPGSSRLQILDASGQPFRSLHFQ